MDAVQAMGKTHLSFRRTQVDLLSLSGHKFGAPKGVGLLLVRHGLSLLPLIDGGGQQNERRSGTENAPLVEALALAAEITAASTASEFERIQALNLCMQQRLMSSGLPFSLVCTAPVVPHILTLQTPGLRAETLLNALSAENIMISAGSACSTGKTIASPVLKAIGSALAV
jgi:cysteine desulfurase